MNIRDILKPKSKEEVKKEALKIEDPNILLNIAIYTIENLDLVKIALKRGADPNKILGNIKNKEILKEILKNSKTKIIPNELIYKALKFGLEDTLIQLIDSNRLNPKLKNYIILTWTVGFGHLKLFKKIIKDIPSEILDKNKDFLTEAIGIAIARKKNDFLKVILKDKRFNLDTNNSIEIAVKFGNTEALKMLLNDERINPDPSIIYEAIEIAKEENYKDIVKFLLEYQKKYKKMGKIVKESLIEQTIMAEPATKPKTKPGVKPGVKPGKPSPIRRERPSVTPRPKASAEDVAEKFLNLIKK